MKSRGKEKTSPDNGVCNSSTINSRRRLKRNAKVIESPDWLPKGWITEVKTRVTGSSAGAIDKYYYDPVTNKRFPSKVRVFEFLQSANSSGFQSKRKADDLSSKISVEERTNIKPGGRGTQSTFKNIGVCQDTSEIDANKKPNRVIWALDGTENSWRPLVHTEEMNGSNREKEKSIPNGNSAYLCCEEQSQKCMLENSNPSKGLVQDTQPEIEQNKPYQGSSIVSPFENFWSDPCLKFDLETWREAFPFLYEDSDLWETFKKYMLPKTNADEKL